SRQQFGVIDNWLCHIKDVYRLHAAEIDGIDNHDEKVNRLIELNVKEQVFNLCTTSIVQNAWKNNQNLAVHGMVIDIATGKLINLDNTISSNGKLGKVFAFKNRRRFNPSLRFPKSRQNWRLFWYIMIFTMQPIRAHYK